MERAVGEVFDFNGVKLQVQDAGYKTFCNGCYFDKSKYICFDSHIPGCRGFCLGMIRNDGKNVIFVEVKDNEK